MTPEQRGMCHAVKLLMGRFYEDPENEAKFLEWKEARGAISSATDLTPRAPSACRPRERRTANHTA